MNTNISISRLQGAIEINQERCKGCGLCIEACPKKIIEFAGKSVNSHGYTYVEAKNTDACIGCSSCGIVCPDACITVFRIKN